MIECYFKKYLALDCPGCGMQRAFSCLINGDVLSSLEYNSALIPLLLTFVLLAAQLVLKLKEGGKLVLASFVITVIVMFTHLVFKWADNLSSEF